MLQRHLPASLLGEGKGFLGMACCQAEDKGKSKKYSFHDCSVDVSGINKYVYKRGIVSPLVPDGFLVGDKRGLRRGQTRPSWGTNETLVGDKRQTPVRSTCEADFSSDEADVGVSGHFFTYLTDCTVFGNSTV